MADAAQPVADKVEPVAASVAEIAPAAPPAVEVKAEAAPAVEAPVVEKAEPHPIEVPSLLEDAGKKPDVEVKPEDKKAEVEPPVAAAPEPAAIEWDFKLPETLKADDATIGKFKDALNGLIKPKEGETPSHAAQRLLGMHNDALVQYDKLVRENQVKAWNETRAGWRTQALADPEIGGAGHNTAMGAIARVRDALVSDAKVGSARYNNDVKELNDFLRTTGAGDHPVFLKILHRAARYVDEPSAPTVKATPAPDAGKRPNGRSLYADGGSSR